MTPIEHFACFILFTLCIAPIFLAIMSDDPPGEDD